LRAMIQKSEALLVTKASLCFDPEGSPPPPLEIPGWQPANSSDRSKVQTNAEINRMDFSGRIGFLGD